MNTAAIRKLVGDELRFLKSLAARPGGVGAIAPSSGALARAIAAQVDPSVAGDVLELGPGTGVVTAALMARGIAPGRLVAIEYDPALAALVSRRFPGVRIIRGDAFDLARTLADRAPDRFAAIVSGLPLLNFPLAQRSRLMAQIFARLAPAAPFVQFSYGLKPPVPPPEGATVRRAAVVYRNLPPARVWVYHAVPV